MARVDQQEARRLLLVIDEEGTRLTKSQINFVADLIDNSTMEFTPEEYARLVKIHYKKVINGKPDID